MNVDFGGDTVFRADVTPRGLKFCILVDEVHLRWR